MATEVESAETEAVGAPEATPKGSKKKVIVIAVVAALAGAFVAKSVFLKPAPRTEAEQYAADKAAALELWAMCAHENRLPFDPDAAAAEYAGNHPLPDGGTATHPTPAGDPPEPGTEPADGGEETHEGAGRGGLGLKQAPGGRSAAAGAGGAVGNPVLEVEAITINLAGDHYLKVGLGLELAPGADPEAAKVHGTGAPARDLLIRTMSNRAIDELRPVEVRDQIQRAIGYELCRAHDGSILRVYFTDFVMQ